MELSQAIELFLKFKSKELSERTLKEYRNDLELFKKIVGNKDVEFIKTADIMIRLAPTLLLCVCDAKVQSSIENCF